MAMANKTIRWPRTLSPSYLANLIRRQKNPLSAVHLFLSSPSLFPSYRHNPLVISSLSSVLLSSPSLHPLIPPLLKRSSNPSLPDSLFAEVISSLPLHLSLPLFVSLPTTSCIEWTHSFNSIISKLLSLGQPKTAIEIFVHFSRRPEVQIESQTLDKFIFYLLLQVGRPDLALELYKEYYNLCLSPSREISCMLVKSLVKHDMLDEAMHLLYSMMKNYNIEAVVVTCRTVIEALCVNGRADEGGQVLKRVLYKVRRRTGQVRSFLRVPIDFEGKSVEEVRETVDFVLSVSGARSVKAYETIATDLYTERRFQGADNVFDEMASKGFKPSVCMYDNKIEALCREGKVNDAVWVLEYEMREKDCAPTIKTFNLVIQGLCNNGESSRAIDYLKNMNRWPGCGARKETFEILIDGLCTERLYNEAGQILDQMIKHGHKPKDETFGCVIQGLCKVGNRYEVVLWLEEMVEHGMAPDCTLWHSLVCLVCGNDVYNSGFEVLEE